jgi:hypothetical protein
MFGEKCDPSVIAEIPVTRPVYSPELHEGQLLAPVKHPAGYRPGYAEILGILISLGGRIGHAIRFTPAGIELSTGATIHVFGLDGDVAAGRDVHEQDGAVGFLGCAGAVRESQHGHH